MVKTSTASETGLMFSAVLTQTVSNSSRREWGKQLQRLYDLTVLFCQLNPDSRSISIDYNVLNSVLSPFFEYPGNFLPCFDSRGLKAHYRHGRLDA